MGVCGIRTCVLPERDDGAAGISENHCNRCVVLIIVYN